MSKSDNIKRQPKTGRRIYISMSEGGVLSKSSDDILGSSKAREQLDSFVELREIAARAARNRKAVGAT